MLVMDRAMSLFRHASRCGSSRLIDQQGVLLMLLLIPEESTIGPSAQCLQLPRLLIHDGREFGHRGRLRVWCRLISLVQGGAIPMLVGVRKCTQLVSCRCSAESHDSLGRLIVAADLHLKVARQD